MQQLIGFRTSDWGYAFTFRPSPDDGYDFDDWYPPYMPLRFGNDTWWWERGEDEPVGWFNVEGSVLRAQPIWEG